MTEKRAWVVLSLVLLLDGGGFGQSALPAEFDVASIKPAAIPAVREGGNRFRIEYSPKSLTMLNVGPIDCVQWAYGAAFFQIAGAGMKTDSYDILAKTGVPVPVGQLKVMLRELLAKRFKLAIHRETRMLPVYELVVAKGGPRLPTARAGTSVPPVHAAESLPRIRDGSFVFEETSMTEFAEKLSQLRGIDLPVVDHTGIQGVFDITLKSAASAILQPDGPSLFTIVQEQLGLRLVSTKAPMEMLVIDHLEKVPTEN